MKGNLFLCFLYSSCLFCLPCFSQSENFSGNSDAMFSEAIERIVKLHSMKANIRMNVFIDDDEFTAQGKCLEKALVAAPNDIIRSKFRLDLTFPLSSNAGSADVVNKMIVLCNSEQNRVWHYTSIENTTTQNWINIESVVNAVKRSKKQHHIRSVGGMPGLGGMAGMLRGIKNGYDFTDPPEDSLLKGKTPLKIWKLKGRLGDRELKRLLDLLAWKEDRNTPYPSHLPVEVEIYLGKDDLFPYRIHYYNLPKKESKQRTPVMQLVFCDVLLNDSTEIPDYLFSTFGEKGGDTGSDITAQYIRSLGL
ncbi:MAG TPA: hypothetical protein DEB39_06810 [Planctomycetaceae bacterium]|nr:hypothetical protein [Planctomycetaceae bacterium]